MLYILDNMGREQTLGTVNPFYKTRRLHSCFRELHLMYYNVYSINDKSLRACEDGNRSVI